MSTDLTPLCSIEAEQSVIGGLLIDNDAIHHIGGLREQDLYRREHRLIFRVIHKLIEADKPCDVVTLAEALDATGDLEKIGGLPYLMQLEENTPSAANVAAYAEIVVERAHRRYALKALDDGHAMFAQGSRPAADVIADVQSGLESIALRNAGTSLNFGEVISQALDAATAASQRRRLGGLAGVPTGMRAIDDRTGGIYGPRLWIVAGRPSLGKSALALQWALHAAGRDHAVGIVSLEMRPDEMGQRALGVHFGLNAAALGHGDSHEIERMKSLTTDARFTAFKGIRLFLDVDSHGLGAIVSLITEWRRTRRIDYAIVDHIGLIEADGFSTRNEQLGHVSRTFKKLAKRLNMPIIAVSQLNRSAEKEKRRPSLADLRDSGNLEQDADIVVMMHAEPDDDSRIEIGLLKNRAGVKGWLHGAYLFSGRTQTFAEIGGSRDRDAA